MTVRNFIHPYFHEMDEGDVRFEHFQASEPEKWVIRFLELLRSKDLASLEIDTHLNQLQPCQALHDKMAQEDGYSVLFQESIPTSIQQSFVEKSLMLDFDLFQIADRLLGAYLDPNRDNPVVWQWLAPLIDRNRQELRRLGEKLMIQ